MRLRGVMPAILAPALAGAIAAGVTLTPPARSATSLTGNLAAFGQTSTVGALFSRTPSGHLESHFCTASVVDSPTGDLVVTAAHCMRGQQASQVAFVPDYSAGSAPYGSWNVTRVIEDARWVASGDPADDFAFLIVSQPGSTVSVQNLTGGATIGVGAPAGSVEVAGYPDSQDTPISCENTVTAYSATQWEFDCGGFTDGTSGSPLLAQAVSRASQVNNPAGGVAMVIGVIGGYHQGGYRASVSYAARFSSRLATLYQTAISISGR